MTHRQRRRDRRRSGFTLIELLVVLVILGLIAGIAVPQVMGQGEKAAYDAATLEITKIEESVQRFKLDMGRYPTQEEGLDVLIHAPADSETKWAGPYLKEVTDPWGNEYVYRSPGEEGRKFEIFSLGADGKEGGDGYDKDLANFKTDE